MLVVDDSPVIRELIAVNLELEGFEVFLRRTAGSAWIWSRRWSRM